MKTKLLKKILLIVGLFFLVFPVGAQEKIPVDLEALIKKETTGAASQEIPAELKAMAENTKEPFAKTEIVADVSIRNAEISEIKKNQLKLVFDLENYMEVQSNLIYGLELIKVFPDKSESLMDAQVFSNDKITVDKNKSVHREIEYFSPEYLSGDFVLWLKVKDESGLTMALQSFQVNLFGTEKYLEQANPCYLTIGGEENKKYSLRQGVDVRKEEKLFLECQTRNFSEEMLSVIPSVNFFRRDLYGPEVGSFELTDVINFKPKEEKLTKVAIPLPKDPQAYDAKIVLKKDGKIFSNPVVVHFVLAGKSATINNLTLDKTKYKAGETAKLNILWARSADTFRGSRTGGSALVDPIFEIEIKSQDEKYFCSPKQTRKPTDFKKIIEVMLDKDCVYPVAIVKILDEGRLLYEKKITTEPDGEAVAEKPTSIQEKETAKNLSKLLSLMALVFIASILIWLIIKKRGRKISTLVFLLFFCGLFFVQAKEAGAKTSYLYSNPSLITYSQAQDAEADLVGIEYCGYTGYAYCDLTNLVQTGCFYVYDGYKWYYWQGDLYGCYSDIIGFTYDLSATSVNQGANILASGTVTGEYICNNGVTAWMAVYPFYDNASRKEEYNLFINGEDIDNNSTSQSGSYTFSTTGLSCQSHQAGFLFGFSHGTGGTINNVEYGGWDVLNYSVKNCCTPTCATGPGCRSSLAGGEVVAGTCCGGTSCYACRAGYTWNGSSCVAITYSCTGSVPSYATMFSGDNVGLTANTAYIYSATDTGTRCEYSCNAGYVWDGSACVGNDSQCVSVTGVPLTANAGDTFTAQVTIRNSGTKTWNSDASPHRLGSANPQDNTRWGLSRVGLPTASVAPGGTTTFNVLATAPSTSGTYSFSWRMVEDSIEWFGPVCSVLSVVVTAQCGSSIPAGTSEAYDSAESTGLSTSIDWHYSSSDTATKCEYKCKTGYAFYGGQCMLSQPGDCSDTYDKKSFCTLPTPLSDLCSVGTPSTPVFASNKWTWICDGINGGTPADCSATKQCPWTEVSN